MDKINNFYVDENNNRWDADIYTKSYAQKCSESLVYCHNCSDCSCCRNCSDCHNCHNCHYCRDCSNCHNCSDFNINPQRYVTPKVGSRDDNTTIYWVGNDVQVVCGCFRGNVDEWEAKIKETHKYNEKHLKDYLEQVENIKKIMELSIG